MNDLPLAGGREPPPIFGSASLRPAFIRMTHYAGGGAPTLSRAHAARLHCSIGYLTPEAIWRSTVGVNLGSISMSIGQASIP